MFGNTFGLVLLMGGVDVVAVEEPVIQNCMISQLSGRPKSALLAENRIRSDRGIKRRGGGIFFFFRQLLNCLYPFYYNQMLFATETSNYFGLSIFRSNYRLNNLYR